jgi:iron complex outermembrane recepter protein
MKSKNHGTHVRSTGAIVFATLSLTVLMTLTASAGEELEQIVVVAQKRVENIQDVPISITALSADALQTKGVSGTEDLATSVPGLVFHHTANEANFFIRGVGTNLFGPNTEQTVALFVDGVYFPAPEANIFDFNNIERIEVLKGPQGTLFGRNTTGGVIQVITRDPSQIAAADISVGYGNYDTSSASFYATTGLASNLAVDIAGLYENQGRGFGTDFTTGRNIYKDADNNISISNKWLFEPSDLTSVRLRIDFSHTYNTTAPDIPPGVIGPDHISTFRGYYNSLDDVRDFERVNTGGVSLNIDHDFGNFRFVSISSYRQSSSEFATDQDGTPLPISDIVIPSATSDWTQEFQLQSGNASKIKWTLGTFYYNAKAAFDPADIDQSGQHIILADKQSTQSSAVFAQATAPLVLDTNLTLGLRYTTENQQFAAPTFAVYGSFIPVPDAKQKFDKLTFRVALDHRFTSDVLGYVSYNRGFKSGGFNLIAPFDAPYKPETLNASEVGLKTELFSHRLRLNSAAFFYDYKDIQTEVPVTGGTKVINGPAATIKGAEFDFEALATENLSLNGGVSFLHGRYTDFARAPFVSAQGVPSIGVGTGRDTIATPPLTANFGPGYRLKTSIGDIRPQITVLYDDGYFFFPDNRLKQPAYVLLNSQVAWTQPSQRYSVRVWGKNLTDRHTYQTRSEQTGIGDQEKFAPPRTFGVTFDARF